MNNLNEAEGIQDKWTSVIRLTTRHTFGFEQREMGQWPTTDKIDKWGGARCRRETCQLCRGKPTCHLPCLVPHRDLFMTVSTPYQLFLSPDRQARTEYVIMSPPAAHLFKPTAKCKTDQHVSATFPILNDKTYLEWVRDVRTLCRCLTRRTHQSKIYINLMQ